MTDTHVTAHLPAHADSHGHVQTHGHGHGPPKHPYHLVDPSPWPWCFGGPWPCILYLHGGYVWLLIVGVIAVLSCMAIWWRDVIREATFQGMHTPVVQLGLRYG